MKKAFEIAWALIKKTVFAIAFVLKFAVKFIIMVIVKAAGLLWALAIRTGRAVVLVPTLVRKPAILYRWLLTAHLAQFALLLVVITVPTYIPSLLDARYEKRYPPIVTERMLGLVRDFLPDSRLERSKKRARVVLWTGSAGLVLYLFLLHIPGAVSRSAAQARKRESKADSMADSRPSESVLLYNSALSLISDPAYEIALRSKLEALDKRLSESDGRQPGATPGKVGELAETVRIETVPERSSHKERAESARAADTLVEGVGPENRYSIGEELGRGAMGIVFRAYDRVLERDVALKQLPIYLSREQQLVARFQQEARALARLSHQCIVQVYDFVRDENQSWIAMELIEGEELEKILNDSGKLPVEETMRLAIQLAEALAYAHERGVVHRDFKPANVLLTKDGLPKITDFGLAKLARSAVQTIEGSALGTPAYMSPEQALGKGTDSRSDIYALGVMLHKMLTGSLPFEGDLERIISQKLSKDPTPLPELDERIPEPLKLLVTQMLAKNPDERPAGMKAVAETLKSASNT